MNLTYDFEINDNVSIFVYGGVNLQFTPVARTTYRVGTAVPTAVIYGPRGGRLFYATTGETTKYDHLWGEEPDMRPFNIYAGGGVGVMLGDIRIMAGYDHSLLNVSRIDGPASTESAPVVPSSRLVSTLSLATTNAWRTRNRRIAGCRSFLL